MNPLLNKMLSCADPSQVEGLARFFKTGPGQYGHGDKFLGIKVPVTRSVVRECWKQMLPEDWPHEGFSGLEECISSEFHEVRLAALLTLVEIFRHARKDPALRQRCVEFYLAHTQFINNWDLVDLSCYPLLGEWLLDKDRALLYAFICQNRRWLSTHRRAAHRGACSRPHSAPVSSRLHARGQCRSR